MFAKPNYRTVPIGYIFEDEYKEKKVSKMQEISLMKNHTLVHLKMVVKNRDIRSTADFISLVNIKAPSKIRKLVGIVQVL